MFRLTLKGLLARKLRLFLTAISITLGVAFVTGSLVLGDTMTATFDQLYAGLTKGTDVTVRSRAAFTDTSTLGSPKPIPAAVVDQVRAVPGVAAAEGTLTGYALMLDKAGKPIQPGGAPTLGAGFQTDAKLASGFSLRKGRGPTTADEVVVDAATARKSGFAPGDRIGILFESGGQRQFTVVGIAGFGEADNLAGATIATFQTAAAQDLLGKPGQYDAIDVRGDAGIKPDALRARISAALPAGLEAVTSSTVSNEASRAVRDGLSFFTTAFLAFAAVSLFVGAFIIWNTFSILVTQRSREHALLRAIGAGRRQILGSVLVEAVVVGLVASALGLLAGLAVASGLRGLMGLIGVELPTTTLQLQARTVIAALAVGVGVTVVAAAAPAWKATRIPPIAALRDAATPARGLGRLRRIAGASSQLAAGIPSGAADKLRRLPEIGTVSAIRFGRVQVAGATTTIAAIDPATADRVINLDVASGSVGALGTGAIMVSADVAKAQNLNVGSPVTVKFAQTGDRPLRVVGTYRDTTLVGASYLISVDTHSANFSDRLDVAVLVKARDGVSATRLKQAAASALADYPNVSIQDTVEFNKSQGKNVDQLLGLVNVLLALAVLIALLGVVNTLVLSVIERTRELGLLRAVGMTRRQVRSAIRWESVLIAAVGAVFGACLGLAFGAAFARALASQGITTLQVPVVQPIVYAVVAALAGVLAAITPARRAAKVDILRAVVAE
jgi:ABC-type antimicrobial peptide transport system permease subunit